MRRAVSGMRPTGGLHIGHWRGVLRNWCALQDEGDECFFFVADWHALTTDYADPGDIGANIHEMTLAWLAAGVDPARAVIFRQSDVPAHAELCVLLSMICPLPWLYHLPTYKEQKEQMQRDLDTLGFLSYPLLQSADIMLYSADRVPVGEDQLPHLEFVRDVARRFNRIYGATESFQQRRAAAAAAIGEETDARLRQGKARYAETGDKSALEDALEIIEGAAGADDSQKRALRGDLLFDGEEILKAPEALLTETPKMPGTDGRKMSKSYDNTIDMFDDSKAINAKIAAMQTDPARARRTDPGDPDKCPVWTLHKIFSDSETQEWANRECRVAGIGCVECKRKLADFVNAEMEPVRARRAEFEQSGAVADILADGARRAREAAAPLMDSVRSALRISPS